MISQEEYFGSHPNGRDTGCGRRGYFPSLGAPSFGGLSQRHFRRHATNRTDRRLLLAKDTNGYWTGFVEQARGRRLYHFWVDRRGLQRL